MTDTLNNLVDPAAAPVGGNGTEIDKNRKILRADNHLKMYKKRAVVKDISVYVQQGEIVGFLARTAPGRR